MTNHLLYCPTCSQAMTLSQIVPRENASTLAYYGCRVCQVKITEMIDQPEVAPVPVPRMSAQGATPSPAR
jgi:hypothetical protein